MYGPDMSKEEFEELRRENTWPLRHDIELFFDRMIDDNFAVKNINDYCSIPDMIYFMLYAPRDYYTEHTLQTKPMVNECYS